MEEMIKQHITQEMENSQRFASQYTSLFILFPFAASACAAILQTWFNQTPEQYFMLFSQILMFIGFVAIALVRVIYAALFRIRTR